MRLFRRRRRPSLTGGLLLGVLTVCSRCGVAGAARALVLPTVLVRTNWIWVGDLCRATQSSTIMYVQPCAPGYTVDFVIYGHTPRHSTLLRLPQH